MINSSTKTTRSGTFVRRPPSLEDKRQFRGNMYKINSDQLGEIVQTLEQQCPEAISKVGAYASMHLVVCVNQFWIYNHQYIHGCVQVASKDEVEINIDKIQPRTFHYLNNLVKSNLPEKKRCVRALLVD